MNQVKTYLDKSKIHGIGLFAGEFIPKGGLIWKFSAMDQKITKEEFEKLNMSEEELTFIRDYAYGKNGEVVLCSDNAKYANHSYTPNSDGYLEQYALQDIEKGDEITCDYRNIVDDFNPEEYW